MFRAPTLVGLLAPLLCAFAAGCAPAYHWHPGCDVDCKYCAPPPLPYVHYKGCKCHSCAASKYLSVQPSTVDVDLETGTGGQYERQ